MKNPKSELDAKFFRTCVIGEKYKKRTKYQNNKNQKSAK